MSVYPSVLRVCVNLTLWVFYRLSGSVQVTLEIIHVRTLQHDYYNKGENKNLRIN